MERLNRNRGENRLANKPTKRDIEWSEGHIRKIEQKYRFNSFPGELGYENYLRIENTNLSATEVSNEICEFFAFE